MSKRLLALFLLCLSARAEIPDAPPGDLRMDFRFEQSPSYDDKIDETLQYRHRLKPWLEVEGALRMAQTLVKLQAIQYKAQADFPLLSFFSLSSRFTQSSFISPGFSTTQLGLVANFNVPLLPGWRWYLSAGYFFRFAHLQNALPVPFIDSSFMERHWMALVGTSIALSEHWKLHGWAATYESLDIFNFHNPYGALSVHYRPKGNWEYIAYARHRILLGFGRRDAFMAGVGLMIPLDSLNVFPAKTNSATVDSHLDEKIIGDGFHATTAAASGE